MNTFSSRLRAAAVLATALVASCAHHERPPVQTTTVTTEETRILPPQPQPQVLQSSYSSMPVPVTSTTVQRTTAPY
ncbi:MAG: hypothetical protein JWO94_3419 [Verrucomicrobiaceae bacterium]|nr:hypothetical protein [Verrucomicrobiaceae bacterium]